MVLDEIATPESGQKQRVRDFFDSDEGWQGALYCDRSDGFALRMRRRMQTAMEMLKNAVGVEREAALDVGCGAGEYMRELAAMGFDPFGIDLSQEMLNSCGKRLGFDETESRMRLRQADIEDIPFDNGRFGLVLGIGVFGYLLSDERAVNEIRRILKPGGLFLVSVANMMSLSDIDYVLRTRLRTLFRPTLLRKVYASPDRASMWLPWVLRNSPTHHLYKFYDPWRFQRYMKERGFDLLDAMTVGYEFRLARKLGILPEPLLANIETNFERFFRKIRVPYFSYSGGFYTGMFRKV